MPSYWYVVTTSQGDIMTTSHQYVSPTSQISLKWNPQRRLSGTSPRRLSGTYPRRPVRLYKFSCNPQIKHAITSLWYVSTTSRSYVVATPYIFYGLYYVFRLLCYDLHLTGFHVSFNHQIKDHIFLVPTKTSSFDYKLELLLHLKTASYINNICNIYCVDI